MSGGGSSVRENVCEVPFRLAANTMVALALMADAFTGKLAAVEPAVTVTDAGIVTLAAPPNPVVTVSPALGAGADTVTVQEAEPGVVTMDGLQTNPVAT